MSIRAPERYGEDTPVRVEGRIVGGNAGCGDGEALSDHTKGRVQVSRAKAAFGGELVGLADLLGVKDVQI